MQTAVRKSSLIRGVSCAILVGGESKRIGKDKAGVEFLGKTLFMRVFDVASLIFKDIMVSAHTPDHPMGKPIPGLTSKGLTAKGLTAKKLRLIPDTLPGRGPALGVCSALKNSRNPWVFVLACDMPMVSKRLIRHISGLRKGYDCVAPVAGHQVQTLFALYKKTCLEPLARRVKEGRRGIEGFLKESKDLRVRYVTERELKETDPDFKKSFMDVDTIKELKKAESMFEKTASFPKRRGTHAKHGLGRLKG
ncbi:MAG: molybdenum cofactor guanylyltransferase [Deltaproteobacteria bacterium]|nr:molybdenum cofactor guanylyltransferase [Deltaproteobacteria bacterium]